jgi:hypothetical protein
MSGDDDEADLRDAEMDSGAVKPIPHEEFLSLCLAGREDKASAT